MNPQGAETTEDGEEISRTEFLPFLVPVRELRRRGFLWPGIATAFFSIALLASTDNETAFFWFLGSYISVANLYILYLCCGKKLPFMYVFTISILAFALDALLAPAMVAGESSLPSLIAPGLVEETVKALPLLIILTVELVLSRARQRRFGLREPLDGILLATASATGFAFLETMFIYVPKYGALSAAPRLLDNVFGHIAFSGALGYFIGLAVLRHRRIKKVIFAVVIGFVVANVLHDAWDVVRYYSGKLAILSPLHYMLVAIMSFFVLASMILKARDVSPVREFLWPSGSLLPYRAPWVGPPPVPVPPHLAVGDEIWLVIGHTRIALSRGQQLSMKEIPCLKPREPDGIVAEIVPHPADASVLVLRNLSKATWEAVLPDGTVRDVGPAQTVRLNAGTRLDFGALSGAILVIAAAPETAAPSVVEWC